MGRRPPDAIGSMARASLGWPGFERCGGGRVRLAANLRFCGVAPTTRCICASLLVVGSCRPDQKHSGHDAQDESLVDVHRPTSVGIIAIGCESRPLEVAGKPRKSSSETGKIAVTRMTRCGVRPRVDGTRASSIGAAFGDDKSDAAHPILAEMHPRGTMQKPTTGRRG